MRRFVPHTLVFAIGLAGAGAWATAGDDQAVVEADRAFVQAIGKADKTAVGRLLDTNFAWIDAAGKFRTRDEALKSLPKPAAGYDAEAKEQTYGRVGTVQVNSGKLYVLRVWVQRPAGWRALVYQEVRQADAPPAASGPGVRDCENPCLKVPYKPKSAGEHAVLTSWQELEKAVTAHDSAEWSRHTAQEFIQVSSANDHPLDKAGRMAALDRQKQTGAASAPPPLVAAQMFDFGETVVMRALHQPHQGKPVRVTRVWIKRDGQWLLSISYQTVIQA